MAEKKKDSAGLLANDLLSDEGLTDVVVEEVVGSEQLLKGLDDIYQDTIIRLVAVHGRNQSPIRITPFQTRGGQLMTGQKQLPPDEMKKTYVLVVDAMTSFTLLHNQTLDLRNPYDATTWGWIKYFPHLAHTAEDVNEDTLFFVENKKAFIRQRMTQRQKRDRATDLVRQADNYQLIDLCLLIGEKVQGIAREEIIEMLRNVADADPDRILDKADSPDRYFYSLVKHLVDLRFFAVSNGTFSYKGTTIGRDEQGAVAWLKDRSNLDELHYLERELKALHRI